MTRNNHDKVPTWKKIAAGTVAALGTLSVVGCATEQVPPPPATASQTGEATPSATPTSEFTPGATGKFSPEALAELNDKQLVEVLKVTGNSPEEVVQSEVDAITAYLMSGANEADIAPYAPYSTDDTLRFVADMEERYGGAACVAWSKYTDPSSCKVNEDAQAAHAIMLHAYATKRRVGVNEPDFQLGRTKLLATEVISGTFDSGKFTVVREQDVSSNFDNSIMRWLTEDPSMPNTETYLSIKNILGKNTLSETYAKVGTRFITDTVVHSSN